MADREAMSQNLRQFYEADFLPIDRNVGAQDRVANALDYIAFHAGQIDKKLGELNEHLKRIAGDYPKPR